MSIIKFPTDAELQRAFEDYTLAVGKVSFAFNYLQEQLCELFVAVIMAAHTPQTGRAIWYCTDSDRSQRLMLEAAIKVAPPERWQNRPRAREDLLWLMEKANSVANKRNDAVHAPCSAAISENGTEMMASFFSLHQRARNLHGKELLVEFDYCERFAETLSRFTKASTFALHVAQQPWPDRPTMPNRRPKKTLQGQPLPDIPI
jgi:hypothetical protein